MPLVRLTCGHVDGLTRAIGRASNPGPCPAAQGGQPTLLDRNLFVDAKLHRTECRIVGRTGKGCAVMVKATRWQSTGSCFPLGEGGPCGGVVVVAVGGWWLGGDRGENSLPCRFGRLRSASFQPATLEFGCLSAAKPTVQT